MVSEQIKIIKAQLSDLCVIMSIIEEARRFMRDTGNYQQWGNGYPSETVIVNDINRGNSYLCIDENGAIIGSFCFMQGEEITYLRIYEGKWLNDEPYGVIHRLAGNVRGKGVADSCFRWCFNQCKNIRIDTHQDNLVMRKILKNNGFVQCGIIYLENASPRLAFQKTRID
ncbi:acetyltransferase [Bacteroidia bacterium]|nr:acetyltransferase [Bacteroidia bacterium]GHV42938.1 acetyltransferase [Bacteroidia bacterium]